MRLLLIRHGESEGNAQGRLQGQVEFSLSELGALQVRALGERLGSGRIDALYSSPLRRAWETAKAVSAATGVEIAEEERLQEYDFGELSGLTWPEINDRHPEIIREYQRQSGWPDFPGDEGRSVFLERVREAFAEIVVRHSGDDEDVAVVTHGGPIIVYVFETLGREYSRPTPFQVENTSITTVAHGRSPGSFADRTIVGLNDTCHLVGLNAR